MNGVSAEKNIGQVTADKQMKEHVQQLKQYGMIIALIVIYGIFAFLSDFKNTAPMNVNNLIMQNSYVIILSIGMLLCCLTGNVDLSVGSVVAFTGALAAIMILDYHIAIPIAVIVTLLIGVLIGIWQGFFISFLGISPFIVSLANMLVFRGLTLVVLNGQTKGPMPATFTKIGAGYLPQVFVHAGGVRLELLALLAGVAISIAVIMMELNSRKKKAKVGFENPPIIVTVIKLFIIICIINFFTLKFSLYMGLPFVLAIMLGLILIYAFITTSTVPGRQIYAVGGNKKAAALSGIKTDRVMFWIYTNMGLLAALAGIVLTARNASATPKAGDMFEMDAIAACYIGGTAVAGGVGTVTGAVVGAFIMGVLNNGMSLLGWSVDVQRVIKGLVLLAAVAVDVYLKQKKKS
ncbi:multiple monosaccharide ABC transporter permease [Pectinatus brassicae]|uniref:Xylose transport system permease protein XylH n=1 Tax=Pectinatus brassicae TaxID=862415 RepID=A0A840UKC3_9FIRM|nr:multiple monosaccharide ABC transporter permease [Pectinatus brassicae]MBB5335158.1 putative multiple sugar transport system permease protein [Pectinatus brassicae]